MRSTAFKGHPHNVQELGQACIPPRASWLLLFACVAAPVHALTLGDVSVQSGVGQFLRAVVPITSQSEGELVPECFRLMVPAAAQGTQDVPTLNAGRVAIERIDARTQLVVSSLRPITGRSLRFALQAGCDRAVNREYVVQLDAAPLDVPVVARAARFVAVDLPARDAAPSQVVSPPAVADRSADWPRRVPDSNTAAPHVSVPVPASGVAAAPASPPEVRAAPAPNIAIISAASAKNAQPPESSANATVLLRPARTVAASPVAAVEGGRSVAQNRSASSPDSADALDAEAAALRKRLAGLNTIVNRLQEESAGNTGEPRKAESVQVAVRSATPAPQPAPAASSAIQSTPQAVLGAWWNGSWPVFAAFVGLAALIVVAGLGWRRRRAAPGATLWPFTASPAERRATATSTVSRAPIATPTTKRPQHADVEPEGPITISVMTADSAARSVQESLAVQAIANMNKPNGAASNAKAKSSLAVSEVSHITEEAGVYLAFNRPDRAIEVLRDHLKSEPRSLPDAWLMLLKIYRSENRELEFRALAVEFHQQFNVQAPKWDDLPQSEEAGLAGIPRVLDKIVSLWGTTECREYLDLLLYDNREGQRGGFTPAVYDDLVLLRKLTEVPVQAEEAVEIDVPSLRPAWAAQAKPQTSAHPGAGAPVPIRKTPPPLPMIELELPLEFDLPKVAAEA